VTFGSLFAGIGGFDLGLERAGFECRWQVEINPYARAVLEKHWPNVKRWDDVRTFEPEPAEEWCVDLICGGFPCIDISHLGHKRGIDGEHSGLWVEFARVVRVLRPRFVLVENVAALLVRGMGRVLGDLAALGYDAEWDCLCPTMFGVPQRRDRVFVVATARGRFPEQSCQREILRPRRLEVDAPRAELDARGVRSADGPSDGVDVTARIGACANAIVPQVSEWIGRRIIEAAGPAPLR
jgi:DNA (cytosine-5)-methyltransferase 1